VIRFGVGRALLVGEEFAGCTVGFLQALQAESNAVISATQTILNL